MSSAGANLPERKAAKKLGRCWVAIFRRQGLAEASERLCDAPRTLRGMNACRNPKAGRSIFPELAT